MVKREDLVIVRFGRFKEPIPFSASDQEKLDAPIIETRTVVLEDYPVGYEMVKCEVYWDGRDAGLQWPDPYVRFIWWNEDTGEKVFEYKWEGPNGWFPAFWAKSWIGHKERGEIDRPGKYSVEVEVGRKPSGIMFYRKINFEVVSREKPPEERPTNRIFGRVTDILGNPIQFATVTFMDKSTTTDTEGRYELRNAFGSGEIRAEAPGFESQSKYIEAPAEGELEVNFTLRAVGVEKTEEEALTAQIAQVNSIYEQLKLTPENIPEEEEYKTYFSEFLAKAGLKDWAEKYDEIYSWIAENFGVEFQGKKIPIISAGGTTFLGGLKGLAEKLGLSTAREVLAKAGSAILGALATLGVSKLGVGNILKLGLSVMTTATFVEFICEEAIQSAGMGVYIASRTRDPEILEQAINNYEAILTRVKTIHNWVSYLNPATKGSFDAFFEAAEIQLDNYRKMLDKMRRDKEEEERKTKLSRSLIERLYKKDIITEEKAREYLRQLGYKEEEIEQLFNLWTEEVRKEITGKLRVTSKPSYAEIYVDGKPTGVLTPETISLTEGEHTVTVALAGYKIPPEKQVLIEAGKTKEVHFDLEKIKIGTLVLRSRPSYAAILINGVDTGKMTPEKFELEEGEYTITLKYPGYEPREFKVEIKEGEVIEKYIRLSRRAA